MANIDVRKENGNRTVPEPPRLAPARFVRDLMGWDPFREMAPFMTHAPAGFVPSFEVKETADGYSFRADVPGVKESDTHVTLTGNRLTIAGKREAEHKEQTETYYAYERSYGSFTRSFTLPDGIDGSSAHADLKDGVLTVTIEKLPRMQPKKIPVQTAAKKA